jgi:glycosyltransferase involved in cell wall biosynthesis
LDIAHFSFSASGGAGRVAANLASSQNELGHNAELWTSIDSSLFEQPFRRPLTTATAAFDEWIVKSGEQKTLFSVCRNNISRFRSLSRFSDSYVHLHWTKGLLTNSDITKLMAKSRSPLTWSLHDMAAFTGGCHHAHDCRGFTGACAQCPQAKGPFRPKVEIALRDKRERGFGSGRIRFVAPSPWMAQQAQTSSLLRNAPIEVIYNPIDNAFLTPGSKVSARSNLGIALDAVVGLAIAADLSDPNKGVQSFVDAFIHGAKVKNLAPIVILIGSGGDKIQGESSLVRRLGKLGPAEIARVGPAADFLGLFSIAETAPLVMAEAAAMGVPSAYLESNLGASSLASVLPGSLPLTEARDLTQALSNIPADQRTAGLSTEAIRRFSPLAVAQQYIDSYARVSDDL